RVLPLLSVVPLEGGGPSMGRLSGFDLNDFIARYDTRVFVETGTCRGDGLRYAAQIPFERLLSTEIVSEQVRRLQEDFRGDPRIQIHAGSSSELLLRLLPALGPEP